ncbi:glycoside hydrolase family 3 protein [Actinomadura sp. CNU-125]|uniref:glycoside hydrolase family 3 protein n=1 Tax=Actinomadura sp. CNU-125 TaxID=1904961 RepID=UPI000A888C4D|nr:glycoside hydrolase family 3 N-terminal domain-containing protein [Actinomadura sp. CNU-125]
MTPEEKAAQLAGFWAMPAGPGEPVAPMEDDSHETAPALDDLLPHGLGQLTRVFGTAPVPAAEGAARLRDLQRRIAAANRFGIPAIAHEECLNGFMTWGATVFPSPPAWGATFDPDLVGEMAAAIGTSMRAAGVHQGLAPVLDVVRDARWGRTEECIGEDPQLVAVLGTAYVRGLERSGVAATPKHFAGYSASRAGRNMAPTPIGPRELADVILEPFAMALRDGGARSIMHSYTDVDGVPAAADVRLLTDLLRGELGFTGAVVSDYFGISFLESRHRVAGSRGSAPRSPSRGHRRRTPDRPLLRRTAPGRGPFRRRPRGPPRPGRRPRPHPQGHPRPPGPPARTRWAPERDRPARGERPRPGGLRGRRRPRPGGVRGPGARPRSGRGTGGWRGGWPRSRSCCSPTTGRCRSRAPAGWR